MATRNGPDDVGQRRSRQLRQRLGSELETTRVATGLSLRELARRIGVSPQRLARAERGDEAALTIDLAARMAAFLGLQLATTLHPNGDPVRDRGHLALLERFRRRLPATATWRAEVPVPIPGDLRSGDAVVHLGAGRVLAEAETHLGDVQATERRAFAKARDLGVDRVILLVADTSHNRRVLGAHPEVKTRFPIGTRDCLMALARATLPRGDAIVIL